MIDAIAAIGDVEDMGCWSGTPYHCLHAARRLGWATQPWRMQLNDFVWPRRYWNLRQILSVQGKGGYQYSDSFLTRAEGKFLSKQNDGCVLSFHHHFPRAASVQKSGGKIVYYLDATLAAELDGHAVDINLPRGVQSRALAIERENLALADHVVTMSRWLKAYLLKKKFVDADRVSVVMPGANLDLPESWRPQLPDRGQTGRPFVLGLVGNDWERKGLRFLIEVVRALKCRGVTARIRVIGRCPKDIDPSTTDVIGPIDKRSALPQFVDAIAGCDLGCLFSRKEAFGISVLEFLRVGVPVAGFAEEGPADSLPPDAGFRFPRSTSAADVAEVFRSYIGNRESQQCMRHAAAAWAPSMSWERCLRELKSALATGSISVPIQPWRGLPAINLKQSIS